MNPSVILLYEGEVGKKLRVLSVPIETIHGSKICIFRAMLLEQRSTAHTVKMFSESHRRKSGICSFAVWQIRQMIILQHIIVLQMFILFCLLWFWEFFLYMCLVSWKTSNGVRQHRGHLNHANNNLKNKNSNRMSQVTQWWIIKDFFYI